MRIFMIFHRLACSIHADSRCNRKRELLRPEQLPFVWNENSSRSCIRQQRKAFFEICDQCVDVLETDMEANQMLRDAA